QARLLAEDHELAVALPDHRDCGTQGVVRNLAVAAEGWIQRTVRERRRAIDGDVRDVRVVNRAAAARDGADLQRIARLLRDLQIVGSAVLQSFRHRERAVARSDRRAGSAEHEARAGETTDGAADRERGG